MALVRCEFFSEALALSTSMTVILPQPTQAQIGMTGSAGEAPPPVLYLLHGLSDDDSIWLRRTSIERYVAPLGLAVVMPQVHRSFYRDQVHGGRYWTFLSQELPSLVQRFFRVSDRREDTFVAGLSMGGYGAFQWALRQPERFAAAASLSGALDVALLQREGDEFGVVRPTFGDGPIDGSDGDLWHLLAQRAAQSGATASGPTSSGVREHPALFLCCGDDDVVVEHSRRFVAHAAALGVPLTSEFGPGAHEWGYWDVMIQRVLEWLPLQGDR